MKKTKNTFNKLKRGFTLAEILIVISIIGLVADMTIPVLVQSTREKITIVKLKKMHSVLDQASRMAAAENGPIPEWIDRSITAIDNNRGSAATIITILKNYLRVTKDCGVDNEGCFVSGSHYKSMSNVAATSDYIDKAYKLLLADGSTIGFVTELGNTEVYCGIIDWCGQFIYDVNGKNPPNQFGIDTFYITLTKDKVVPFGGEQEAHEELDDYCKLNSKYPKVNGLGCTAWLIQNENMDYLKCEGLSLSGKRTCAE